MEGILWYKQSGPSVVLTFKQATVYTSSNWTAEGSETEWAGSYKLLIPGSVSVFLALMDFQTWMPLDITKMMPT